MIKSEPNYFYQNTADMLRPDFGRSKTGLLVCFDTGGANAIASLAKSWSQIGTAIYTFCAGPAVDTFKMHGLKPWRWSTNDLDAVTAAAVLDEVDPDFVLLGSSFSAWTERLFCQEARRRGVWSMGLIDWWTNFGLRFSTPGTNNLKFLPDRIGVLDEDCRLACLSDGLGADRLVLTGNPYWDDLARLQAKGLEDAGVRVRRRLELAPESLTVLVASTNIRKFGLGLGYDENDFWAAVSPLPGEDIDGRPIQWLIKPHPQEDRAELAALLARNHVDQIIIDGLTTIEALSAADVVVGTLSSMLMEAALLGRRVVSIQPGLQLGSRIYHKIFQHLGIPLITKRTGTRLFLEQLIRGQLPWPDTSRLPRPLIDGGSAERYLDCCLKGDERDEKQAQGPQL